MPWTLALKKRIPQRLAGRHVGVIGLGQIGGSIAQCLSQYRPDVALYGTDRNKTLRVGFRKYGTWCESVGEMVSLCDLLILSMPI
ncbi:MAG TPA: NAD(P)-dependent oxidoreductase, partial [candidate division Zixibacteria bacterium]|nr:NAD(P)-dependent oxidoreductase [candidate division Zixibacteria bacterium]